MSDLSPVITIHNENVRYYSKPHKFLGLNFGARMTAVKLEGDDLLLYSPIVLDEKTKADLDSFGRVAYIIAPNMFHHLWAGHAKELYPNAQLYGPPGLSKKRKDLSFDKQIAAEEELSPSVKLIPIRGMKQMQELVVFDSRASTLVVCDILQNFKKPKGWWTNFYLKILAGGIHNKPGLSKVVKWAFDDKTAAAESIRGLIALEPVSIIPAHGVALNENCAETIKKVYTWLLA